MNEDSLYHETDATKQLKNRLKRFNNLFLKPEERKEFILNEGLNFSSYNVSKKTVIDAYEIKDMFLEFMTSLLKNYKHFLISPSGHSDNQEMRNVFDVNGFLATEKGNVFLAQLCETTLFSYFIETRISITPKEFEFQFFDDCIATKRTKQEPFLFKPPSKNIKKISVPSLNVSGLEMNEIVYDVFPKLNRSLFYEKKIKDLKVCRQDLSVIEFLRSDSQKDVSKMTPSQWASFLRIQSYVLWFRVLNMKIRADYFQEHYSLLTETAIAILCTIAQKKKSSYEPLFRIVFEACGYYAKNTHFKVLLQFMKNLKIEVLPITFGLYFQGISISKHHFFSQEELNSRIQQWIETEEKITSKTSEPSEKENQQQSHLQIDEKSTGNQSESADPENKINKEEKEGEQQQFEEIQLNSNKEHEKIESIENEQNKNTTNPSEQVSLNESEYHDTEENIEFFFNCICPTCRLALFPEEVLFNWEKSETSTTTKCPTLGCETFFNSEFIVRQIKRKIKKQEKEEIQKSSEKEVQPSKITPNTSEEISEMTISLMSPFMILSNIEKLAKLPETWSNEATLCSTHTLHEIYWNMIFWFKLHSLPVYFFQAGLSEQVKNSKAFQSYKKNKYRQSNPPTTTNTTQDSGIFRKVSNFLFGNDLQDIYNSQIGYSESNSNAFDLKTKKIFSPLFEQTFKNYFDIRASKKDSLSQQSNSILITSDPSDRSEISNSQEQINGLLQGSILGRSKRSGSQTILIIRNQSSNMDTSQKSFSESIIPQSITKISSFNNFADDKAQLIQPSVFDITKSQLIPEKSEIDESDHLSSMNQSQQDPQIERLIEQSSTDDIKEIGLKNLAERVISMNQEEEMMTQSSQSQEINEICSQISKDETIPNETSKELLLFENKSENPEKVKEAIDISSSSSTQPEKVFENVQPTANKDSINSFDQVQVISSEYRQQSNTSATSPADNSKCNQNTQINMAQYESNSQSESITVNGNPIMGDEEVEEKEENLTNQEEIKSIPLEKVEN